MTEGAARLVRLAIAGFKSFAEPAALDILPGLTGIVGPNGCGKSNVTDALRWAMGEASARSLRGGEMDDVIFAGTTARASRNLAEVTVHLEAEPGALPPPFGEEPELAVTRRIERGAGSVYRVNGREVRARDVQTLFADLATGARSSAMVSQGRVAALVGARPEERRVVLEEAAGVSGLHGRRAEAETRLRAAEGNLERAEERRALLQAQLAGLQKQAKQAARYRTVSAGVGEAEALMLAIALARTKAAVAGAGQAVTEADSAVTRAMQAQTLAALEADAAGRALPGLRSAEATARTAMERARLARDGVQDRVARAQAELDAATARRSTAARDLAHAEQMRREAEAASARLDGEAGRLRAEAEAHPPALEQARQAAQAAEAAFAASELAATEAAERAAGLSARVQALEQVLAAAEGRARRAREATARLGAERDKVRAAAPDPASIEAAVAALAAKQEQVTALRARAAAAEAARQRSEPALASARERLAAAEAARTKLAAEVSGLTQVLAVRDGERWPPMLDRVEVPAGLEAAIGAALGEELAAACDPAAGRHWRELPPLAPEGVDGETLVHAVRGPAALQRALSAISIVADASAGEAAQAGLRPGQTLVSRDGGVWRWDGYTVRAGAPTAAAVRLRQRNRLAELKERLDGAERGASAARTARAAAEAEDRAATGEDSATRSALRNAEQALERTRAEADALRTRAEQSQTRLAGLVELLLEAECEQQDAEAAAAEAKRERDAAPDLTLLRAEVERTRAALAAARSREREASRNWAALEQAGVAREARLTVIAREQELVLERARDAAFRVTDLAARVRETAAAAARLAEEPMAAAQAQAAYEAALEAAAAAHRTAAAALDAGERAAAAAAAAERASQQAMFDAREALVRAEAARATAEAGREAAALVASERAGSLELPTPPADVSQEAEERARGRWQRLARERDEMGPVNLRAEIEAGVLQTEIETIDRERDEIGTAIAKLRGVIRHLNREGRERLADTFQQIEQHFQALFARMFGGGRAHLALVGSEDPLLAGLEIYAQPPGKKLATLSLLSGGEQALTALSLIFAVFRCNPAPLCVLDEVDAPLDDANVERFCTLLADMVAETGTRFLVVTHHHLTMARMDRLYGVTMQERGVSRLLSVDLARAAAMVERVAAE